MGKAKKSAKKKNEDSDDAMETVPQTEVSELPKNKKKKAKKGEEIVEKKSKPSKKNKKNVDSEDESEEEEELVKGKSKPVRKVKSETEDSEEDEDEAPPPSKPKGKTKSAKQKKTVQESDEDEEDETPPPPKPRGKTKSAKQKKKAQESDEDEDDESPPPPPKLKAKTKATTAKQKKKKKMQDSDEDEDDVPVTTMTSAFALLDVEDVDVEDDDEEDEPEPEPEPKPKPPPKKEKGDKKGKKSKRKKKEEDDIDKLLEELQLEYSGQTRGVQEVEEEEVVKVEEAPAKKEKKPPKNEAEGEEAKDDDEEVSTVKTAAQKKKEKKQRQLEEKQKAAAAKKAAGKTTKAPAEKPKEEPKPEPVVEEKPPTAEPEDDEDDDGDGKKKKKDKKKKGKDKKEVEDDKKKKKGPGSAAIRAMQEQLKKIQEEEDRIKREEEERLRKEEEEERIREEKLQREKEKKEREKQKKKERLQKAKLEGRYLTPKQKAEKARQLAMLEALRAQGIEVPTVDKPAEKPQGKSRVIQPKGKRVAKGPSPDVEPKQEVNEAKEKIVKVEIVDKKPEKKPEDDIKDSWDQESEEEVKETWDDEKSEPEEVSEEKPEVAEESESEAESEESEEESASEESESEESDSEEEEEEEHKTEAQKKRERALIRIRKRKEEARKKCTTDVLRAPVVCVLGHVDTGKTKILDKLRRTNVQEGEAGGITQQIGATNVPQDVIKVQARMVKGFPEMELKIPGMLIIDTPGHESFSNLRSRGSSLCDIAILVIDIMHGLEPQTIESINLLKKGRTPFIVALNKIDRLYDWVSNRNKDIEDLIKQQPKNTQQEFQERSQQAIVQLAEQGLNAKLCYENDNPREYISLVPTSAWTGDGMGNLIGLLAKLTQSMLAKRIAFSESLQATVLEVKAIPGLGTTIDVILVNGTLREGDTMIVAGTEGPVVTQIRSLLMPQPMKELRVKNAYIEHKEVRAAQGVKIAAKELEKAVAGLNLQVAEHPDEVEILRDVVNREFSSVMNSIKLSERGVYVQASTLGSLEALLEFLRTSKIPYSGVRIGPVVKKDVMRASTMLEHEVLYAVILAFDVKIERDAQELADNLNVKIFQADIIYHLFDSFVKYQTELKNKRKEEHKHIAVFPCKMRILPQFIFNSRDPIVMGVSVEAGVIKEGTPICVPSKEFLEVGVVTTIEINHKTISEARKGQEVCIKIEPIPGDAPKMFGRHFDEKDLLVSKISRDSIDACKNYFRDDLLKSDWQLMIELKKVFAIL